MFVCIAAYALAVHTTSSFTGVSHFRGRKLTEVTLNVHEKGIKDCWVMAVYPPSAATQRNMKSEILLVPFNSAGKPDPSIDTSDVLTRIEVNFTAGLSSQPGVVFRIRATNPKHSLMNGFKLFVRGVADHYATSGYVEDFPAADASQYLGESVACDLSNVQGFVGPVVASGYTPADSDLDLFVISRLAPIKYSVQLSSVFPVSKVIRSSSGDCGGKALALQAQYRAAGVPARVAMGYFGKDGGGLIPHAWVEAARGGNWTPVEASNLDVAKNPGRSIGRPEDAFIMHFEKALSVQYKDPTGQQINATIASLQTPDVRGRTFSGQAISSPNRPLVRQVLAN